MIIYFLDEVFLRRKIEKKIRRFFKKEEIQVAIEDPEIQKSISSQLTYNPVIKKAIMDEGNPKMAIYFLDKAAQIPYQQEKLEEKLKSFLKKENMKAIVENPITYNTVTAVTAEDKNCQGAC